jgi:hypothetical protein
MHLSKVGDCVPHKMGFVSVNEGRVREIVKVLERKLYFVL